MSCAGFGPAFQLFPRHALGLGALLGPLAGASLRRGFLFCASFRFASQLRGLLASGLFGLFRPTVGLFMRLALGFPCQPLCFLTRSPLGLLARLALGCSVGFGRLARLALGLGVGLPLAGLTFKARGVFLGAPLGLLPGLPLGRRAAFGFLTRLSLDVNASFCLLPRQPLGLLACSALGGGLFARVCGGFLTCPLGLFRQPLRFLPGARLSFCSALGLLLRTLFRKLTGSTLGLGLFTRPRGGLLGPAIGFALGMSGRFGSRLGSPLLRRLGRYERGVGGRALLPQARDIGLQRQQRATLCARRQLRFDNLGFRLHSPLGFAGRLIGHRFDRSLLKRAERRRRGGCRRRLDDGLDRVDEVGSVNQRRGELVGGRRTRWLLEQRIDGLGGRADKRIGSWDDVVVAMGMLGRLAPRVVPARRTCGSGVDSRFDLPAGGAGDTVVIAGSGTEVNTSTAGRLGWRVPGPVVTRPWPAAFSDDTSSARSRFLRLGFFARRSRVRTASVLACSACNR